MATDNYGPSHPLDDEVKLAVVGIPGSPAKVEVSVLECSEVEDKVDTFDTAEGRPHSLGRSKSSKDFTFSFYANDTAVVAAFQAWAAATRAGNPGHSLPLIVTYSYLDGLPGRVLELQNTICLGIKDSAGGQQQAHKVTVTCKYQNAKAILV